MAVDRARQPSVPIEALNFFAQLQALEGQRLDAPDLLPEFSRKIADALGESLADERRVHGRWVQDLFRAVLISLDRIAMIKDEDCGEFYYDPRLPLQLPDFRVVTKAGRHLLIEVKNVGKGLLKPQRLKADAVRAQEQYAVLTGARMLYAHYWAQANTWTLVDSKHLVHQNGRREITVNDAMSANELGLLGDRMFMTRSTLSLTVGATAGDNASAPDPELLDMPFPFEPKTSVFAADGVPVTDPDEYELAKTIFLYGGVILTEIAQIREEDGRLDALVFTGGPPPDAETPNVGSWLSKIYTSRYIGATKDPLDGSVTHLRYDPDPGLTRLVAAAAAVRTDRVLPIQVFHQLPVPDQP